MTSLQQSRQQFLGEKFEFALRETVVGVIGLSGGGSHIVQQLAHLGFLKYCLFDPKEFESKHLHRLVGSCAADIALATPKTQIAQRVIASVRPDAHVALVPHSWTESPEILRGCDVVFGCVDSFQGRLDLEVCCRRYLIPYIDIGMTVLGADSGPPRLLGQVAVSLPGGPCLQCMRVVTESELQREAEQYGSAGVAAQVVFANGVLASTAVGLCVQLLSGWRGSEIENLVLRYDGNRDSVLPCHVASVMRHANCLHFPMNDVGDPRPSTVSVSRTSNRDSN